MLHGCQCPAQKLLFSPKDRVSLCGLFPSKMFEHKEQPNERMERRCRQFRLGNTMWYATEFAWRPIFYRCESHQVSTLDGCVDRRLGPGGSDVTMNAPEERHRLSSRMWPSIILSLVVECVETSQKSTLYYGPSFLPSFLPSVYRLIHVLAWHRCPLPQFSSLIL